jgi:hypothetical protein
MNEIRFPEVRTYYICFDNERTEVKSYGWVDPNQVFETIWIFDEFTDEDSNGQPNYWCGALFLTLMKKVT